MIWPFCTFRGVPPLVSSLSALPSRFVLLPLANESTRPLDADAIGPTAPRAPPPALLMPAPRAGRSEMVSRFELFGFCARLRPGGWLNMTFSGSGYIWRGSSESSQGSPVITGGPVSTPRTGGEMKHSLLTFGGSRGSLRLEAALAALALLATLLPPALRQLVLDTDVAAVETLRTLPLL